MVRPLNAAVALDCLGMLDEGGFEEVGTSGFEVGRFDLDFNGVDVEGCVDGTHWLEADMPVGQLSVVGEDRTNSYGYLGGVGLRPINSIVVVK